MGSAAFANEGLVGAEGNAAIASQDGVTLRDATETSLAQQAGEGELSLNDVTEEGLAATGGTDLLAGDVLTNAFQLVTEESGAAEPSTGDPSASAGATSEGSAPEISSQEGEGSSGTNDGVSDSGASGETDAAGSGSVAPSEGAADAGGDEPADSAGNAADAAGSETADATAASTVDDVTASSTAEGEGDGADNMAAETDASNDEDSALSAEKDVPAGSLDGDGKSASTAADKNAASTVADEDTPVAAAFEAKAKRAGWVTEGGKTYYYGEDGERVTGEANIGDSWYYFDRETGAMSVGFTDITTASGDSKRVYYVADPGSEGYGSMWYGELNANDAWYYLDRFDGHMARGITSIVTNGGASKTAYYAQGGPSDGQMQYGEENLNDAWYYFDDFDGHMATGITDITTGGGAPKTVCYGSDGRMDYGEVNANGAWYYFDDFDGHMVTGWKWLESSGGKMVYYGSNGQMLYGTHVIDGYQRRFDTVTGAVDKYGYQNPLGYYQVSTWNVSVPNYSGNSAFSYVTSSQIGLAADRWDCIETMINTAYSYIGTPYVWDYALAPGVGVDCAGLVMQALYSTGMDLGSYTPYDHYFTAGHDHYANDMAGDAGFMTVAFEDRQRGDLIFYNGHVAIYLGDDMVIDSYPGDGADGVAIRSMWHYNVNGIVKRPFV